MLSAREMKSLQKTIESMKVKGGRKRGTFKEMREALRKTYDDDFIESLSEEDRDIYMSLYKKYVERSGGHHIPPEKRMRKDRRALDKIIKQYIFAGS